MLLAAVVVVADYVAHANGGFPRVFGLGFVPSSVLLATALYLVVVTVGMTLALMSNGAVAVSASNDGILVRSAWFAKTLPWSAVSFIGLDVRYDKTSRHTVIVVREAAGLLHVLTVDTRLLVEPLDHISDWIDAAERSRVTRGGTPHVAPSTGLAGYDARMHAVDLAADVAASRRRVIRP